MRRTYKYRVYAGREVAGKAERWLTLCCRLYNMALEQRIAIYRENKELISYYEQTRQLPDFKADFPEYKEVDAHVLQEVLKRLDRAYAGFFRRVKNGDKPGFPRFKGRDRYDSFTLRQNSWELEGKYLFIRNVGRFKLRLSRPVEGEIKTVTVSREQTGNWYVCFSCADVPARVLEKSTESVGIDVGIKSFLVDSKGGRVDNPAYFRQSEGLLRRRVRTLCRRVKGSHGRRKARVLVAKAHKKVVNQRNDFLHKVANQYISTYGYIFTDSSWGKFFELLSYKAEEAGRIVTKIPRFEPSSKTCSECGVINQDLTLNDRQWVCQACGVLHDRDYNAAKNIHRVGQSLREVTYAVAQSVSRESPNSKGVPKCGTH